MALMDMVRNSPAVQLADNLMAQIEEGKAAWESLKTGFLEGVKALKGAGGNITKTGSSMLKKLGTSLERNHHSFLQDLQYSGLPLRRSSDPSGSKRSSSATQVMDGSAAPYLAVDQRLDSNMAHCSEQSLEEAQAITTVPTNDTNHGSQRCDDCMIV
jgi:hypothetical protein